MRAVPLKGRRRRGEKGNKSCHKNEKGEDLYFLNLSSHHAVWYIYTYIHIYDNNMNEREGMDSIEIITDSCDLINYSSLIREEKWVSG